MTAVEEIESAIEKLTGLKEAVSGKYFKTMSNYFMGEKHSYTDLALTLHRTIDAQLAILNAALAFIDETETDPDAVYSDGRRMSGSRLLKVSQWGRAAVELAESINGTAS